MLRPWLRGIIFFGLSLLLTFALFQGIIPRVNSQLTKADFLSQQAETLTYVALGDSLTQGVGDSSQQGGFVPLVAQELTSRYGYQTKSHNFGVAGNTSQQILKRMREDSQIGETLSQADVMSLTVGGNDVMAVIRKNLANLSLSSFYQPAQAYQTRLREIIRLARQDNPDLPIYILGIYNPFYLNFPELTQMQTVIDNWNLATQAVTKEYEGVYFVPINDLLYKGIDGKEGLVETAGDQTRVVNDALFEGDHFHPNTIGYQLMAHALMEEINDTKTDW